MGGCDFLTYFSGPGGFFAGGLVPLLVWGMIVLALGCLAAKLLGALTSGRAKGNRDRADSLTILKTRFAKGEITEEDYLRMRDILEQSP